MDAIFITLHNFIFNKTVFKVGRSNSMITTLCKVTVFPQFLLALGNFDVSDVAGKEGAVALLRRHPWIVHNVSGIGISCHGFLSTTR